MRNLLGPMIFPDGSAMANVTVLIRAQRVNWSSDGLAAHSSEHRFQTDQNGDFVVAVAPGDYQVWYQLPGTTVQQRLGPIAVEDGASVELGELIELSRDKTADYSIAADWATKAYVTAQITLGAQPYDVGVTQLNPGLGTAGQFYRVTLNGLSIEPFTFQLRDFVVGDGLIGGNLIQGLDGKPTTLPVPRVTTISTVAALGDQITVDMNGASGPVIITLPVALYLGQPPIDIYIDSDDYVLPHAVLLRRSGTNTIKAITDDIEITRRRAVRLRYVGGGNYEFN